MAPKAQKKRKDEAAPETAPECAPAATLSLSAARGWVASCGLLAPVSHTLARL